MSNGSHYVVLYIEEGSREFSITARMQSSQLAGVDEQMAQKGYERRVLAEGLDREKAEKMRDRVRAEYEAKGYKYQTRERLSRIDRNSGYRTESIPCTPEESGWLGQVLTWFGKHAEQIISAVIIAVLTAIALAWLGFKK